MSFLFTADIHLSDRPKDRYRFGLFEWMLDQQIKHDVTATFILGDLTVFKDRHSALLVNTVVEGLCKLKPPIFIAMGNHDYTESTSPFFDFLNKIEGIRFVRRMTMLTMSGLRFLIIPHVKDKWPNFKLAHKPDYVLIHQTLDGSLSESGFALEGLDAGPLAALGARKVYGGDVHRPQKIGPVTYVGPPYSITFGEDFRPRVLLLNRDGKETNLFFDCPKKWLIKIADVPELAAFPVRPGDQVRIVMNLMREEVFDWPTLRRELLEWCKAREVDVFGIEFQTAATIKSANRAKVVTLETTPTMLLDRFCLHERIAKGTREVGRTLLRDDA